MTANNGILYVDGARVLEWIAYPSPIRMDVRIFEVLHTPWELWTVVIKMENVK